VTAVMLCPFFDHRIGQNRSTFWIANRLCLANRPKYIRRTRSALGSVWRNVKNFIPNTLVITIKTRSCWQPAAAFPPNLPEQPGCHARIVGGPPLPIRRTNRKTLRRYRRILAPRPVWLKPCCSSLSRNLGSSTESKPFVHTEVMQECNGWGLAETSGTLSGS
jgi:hypothetical protein